MALLAADPSGTSAVAGDVARRDVPGRVGLDGDEESREDGKSERLHFESCSVVVSDNVKSC